MMAATISASRTRFVLTASARLLAKPTRTASTPMVAVGSALIRATARLFGAIRVLEMLIPGA